jgi:acetylglutamate kinase
LLNAGYVPVIEPTALGIAGSDVEVAADDVASAIAKATAAARAIFFHESGGVVDAQTALLIDELTPAEALAIADSPGLAADLRSAIRAAAQGVRGGVEAAQILDGRISHAAIVEFLTARHLGTQVAGTVFIAGTSQV